MSSLITLLTEAGSLTKPEPDFAWLAGQLVPGTPSPLPKHWDGVGVYLGSEGSNSGPCASTARFYLLNGFPCRGFTSSVS